MEQRLINWRRSRRVGTGGFNNPLPPIYIQLKRENKIENNSDDNKKMRIKKETNLTKNKEEKKKEDEEEEEETESEIESESDTETESETEEYDSDDTDSDEDTEKVMEDNARREYDFSRSSHGCSNSNCCGHLHF